MATETLRDNNPPLPDQDIAKPQPNDKEPSEDAAKSEDANVDDNYGASHREVEEEQEAHEKKEEIDEDEGEEKDKEKGKETSKKSKKGPALEKKDPVTPAVSERPTRERKTVERFSVPSPAKSSRPSSSKGFTIEKGRGTQLKDIPNVAFKLTKRKVDNNLHMLHTLLFGKKTKAHNLKRNIGQFSGYVWTENEDKQRAKIKERIDKLVKEKLLDFCDFLNIQLNKANMKKEELSAKLLEFLESPHATTDILLADKEQKGKRRSRKPGHSKSPGEASTETSAKKQKQTSQSVQKQKQSLDEEGDKVELSDAKDDSQEDEDVAPPNDESDDAESKSQEEEEKSKTRKRIPNKTVKESSASKAGDKTLSVKKTSVKDAKKIEKTKQKTTSKRSVVVAEQDTASASISKSMQPASKKQKIVSEKQDNKGKKAASKKQIDKSSKALVKDQVKSKSNKKAKAEPTKQDMHAVVVDILKEVDFNTATLSDILRQLGTYFGLDLMHRKAEVKDIITDVINNMSDEEDEEAENDGDAEKDDDGDEDDA